LADYREPGAVATVDGVRYGYAALLASAWGRPSEAFGPSYAQFDGPGRRLARLPGPPYHFMTRVADVRGPAGAMRVGSRVDVEYDVPDAVWYFDEHGYPGMPFSVLMEVALQPCGWLATYVGSQLAADRDVLFRNLDGTATVLGEVGPGTRVIRTRAELTHVSSNGDTLIESFTVECLADGVPLLRLTTVFGYFPLEAFARQVGLPADEAGRSRPAGPGPAPVDLRSRPSRYCSDAAWLRLPGPMLLMVDRVTDYWPDGGAAGLGRLRGEKRVDPSEWYFRAHFFRDPVQPGSLGIEAMCDLLKFHLIERDAGAGMRRPRFEPVVTGREITWKYRGQVTPANRVVTVEVEIVDSGVAGGGRYAAGTGWLWVDGKLIYQVTGLAVRVVDAEPVDGYRALGSAIPAARA
jgi:3-hydroxymyristoyl/3-hydroxydecanoyl-(acyl carrier protein) dehydratase